MKLKIIITGASGFVGEGVLLTVLMHPDVESVLVIGRRHCNVTHPKLIEILHKNFYNYSDIENMLKGYDACFFCLGVSSVGMKEDEYRKITYDLTMGMAKVLASNNPQMTFCYVSGTGTDSSEKGRLMWARIKGKTENDLMKLSFKDVYAFRPGLIKPLKEQKNIKLIYKSAKILYPVFKLIFPNAVSTVHDIGLAMINAVEKGYYKKILENRDIAKLARE